MAYALQPQEPRNLPSECTGGVSFIRILEDYGGGVVRRFLICLIITGKQRFSLRSKNIIKKKFPPMARLKIWYTLSAKGAETFLC